MAATPRKRAIWRERSAQTGRPDWADEIISAMKSAGYDVRESNPFEAGQIFGTLRRPRAPIVGRVEMLWESMRGAVVETFPKEPGLPKDKDAYLRFVDGIYQSDAYHSLSIEGYSVTPEVIERVRQGNWDPEHHEDDRKSRDALAARGYWQAFQLVKGSVEKVIAGENAGACVRAAHKEWYRELFQPCVAAGLIEPGALAGYRNIPVYLRTSRYVPPRWEAVRDAMPVLFDLLEREAEPVGARRARSLAVRLYPSLPGRQRADGALSDECDAGFGRLSLDGHSGRGPQRLSGRARPRQHRHGYKTVLHVCGAAGAVVS